MAIPKKMALRRGADEAEPLTPLVLEVDPGSINGGDIHTGYTEQDVMGNWHKNTRGNYVALDGSVHTIAPEALFESDPARLRTDEWFFKIHGEEYGFDEEDIAYGQWRNANPTLRRVLGWISVRSGIR